MFLDKNIILWLNRLSYYCYLVNFAFKLQHKALVGIFSFLIRKFQSSEDYGISDPRKLDMRGGGRLDPPPLWYKKG